MLQIIECNVLPVACALRSRSHLTCPCCVLQHHLLRLVAAQALAARVFARPGGPEMQGGELKGQELAPSDGHVAGAVRHLSGSEVSEVAPAVGS